MKKNLRFLITFGFVNFGYSTPIFDWNDNKYFISIQGPKFWNDSINKEKNIRSCFLALENSIKTNWNWKQNWRYLIKHCDIKIKGYHFNLPSKENQNFCPDERENVKKLSASPTFLTLNPLIFHLFLCCSSNIDIFIFVYYVIFETTIIYKFYDNIYYLLILNTIY